eukprot:421571-Pyramimonas_sp.AAC.1
MSPSLARPRWHWHAGVTRAVAGRSLVRWAGPTGPRMCRCGRLGLKESPDRPSVRSALGVRSPVALDDAPSAQPFAFALVGVARASGPRADARALSPTEHRAPVLCSS